MTPHPQLFHPAATVPKQLMCFRVVQRYLDPINEVTLWMYGPDGRYYCEFTLERWPFDDQLVGSFLTLETFLQCLKNAKA